MVQAVQAVLHVVTSPGDGVVVHVPAYPPFFSAIEQTGCRLVPVPARIEDGAVSFDHDALADVLSREPARVMILCNPQNPTGHVFTRAELEHLAGIADRHGLIIISDEIHADLIHDGRTHVPMATVPAAARCGHHHQHDTDDRPVRSLGQSHHGCLLCIRCSRRVFLGQDRPAACRLPE